MTSAVMLISIDTSPLVLIYQVGDGTTLGFFDLRQVGQALFSYLETVRSPLDQS